MKRILSLCLIVLCFLFPCQVKAEKGEVKNLLILGDSIAAHFGVEKDASYETKLKKLLSQNGDIWESHNWARDGYTSGDLVTLLSKYEEEPEKLEVLKNADLITISIGGNNLLDYVRDGFTGDVKALTTALKSDLEVIMHTIRRHNTEAFVLVQTAHNVARDSKDSPLYPTLNSLFSPFVAMLKDEAPRLGYTIADTYAAFAEEPEEQLLRPEKIHPNAKGHTLIADVLFKAYNEKR